MWQWHMDCICVLQKLPVLKEISVSAVIFMAISAQRGKAPSNVNSLTSPQPQLARSTPHCPLLPVSLSGPWQTLWSGLLSTARMFVCSLSHLVAWHVAQRASSPLVHPAWRREIKQNKTKKTAEKIAVRQEAVITERIWVPFPFERRLLVSLTSHKKLCLAMSPKSQSQVCQLIVWKL